MFRISKHVASFSKREATLLFRKIQHRFKFPFFDVLSAPTALPFGRILIVTSRKIGNAAARNLVRRRIKAIFYEEKLFEAHTDYVIFIKTSALGLPFNELKSHVIAALKKARIIL